VATADGTVYEVVPRSTHIALPDGLIELLWLERAVDHPVRYRIDVNPATHVTLADGMRFLLQRTMPGEPAPETREFVATATRLKGYATVSERQFKMEWTIRCLWRAGPSITEEVQVINLPPSE
jgi:hypothetical protein